jgi:vacuolar-type H+-ATPase subunit E/Vma4
MEINEKLEIFSKAAIEAATMQSEGILEEQKNAYQAEISEYRQKKQESWEEREHVLEEKVRKEINREVSGRLIAMKREYHEACEEKKNLIFASVESKLSAYSGTDEYFGKMCEMIEDAKKEARGTEVTVYISKEDEGIKKSLEKACGCDITISDEKFYGGIRAAIPSRNIMIDDTYAARLKKERDNFVLE